MAMRDPLPARFAKSLPLQGCLLALVLISLIYWIRRTTSFARHIELPLYDQTTQLAWPWKAGHPDIVVVAIREATNPDWPLHDDVLATALEKMTDAGVGIIGIDLIRDVPVGGNDAGTKRLWKIGVNERLIWVESEASVAEARLEPPPFIAQLNDGEKTAKLASASFQPDGGANPVIRRGSIAVWSGDAPRFSLSALLAERYVVRRSPNDSTPEVVFSHLLGKIGTLPCSAGGYWLKDSAGICANGNEFLLKPVANPRKCFRDCSLAEMEGNGSQIPIIQLKEILNEPNGSGLLRKALEGKIVLFGTDSANLTKDEIAVVGDAGLRGLRLHALVTAQLLRELEGEAPVRFLSDHSEDGLVLLSCLLALGVLALPRLSPVGKGVGVVLGLPLLFLTAGFLSLKSGIWIPVGAPVLAGSATGIGGLMLLWCKSSNERKTYLKLMTSHLGPEVTARVLARNDLLTAGLEKPPETFEATAFFADLRGYSGASQFFQDNYPAETFYSWLNGILRPAVEITGRHGGFVKQFAGDGIFVIFGFPPESGSAHAQRAVDCALELAALVPELNRKLQKELPPYYMRIGIYTGDIHASSVGGGRHTDYSFLGPTINKAARLESLDKDRFEHLRHPVRILVSGNTRQQLSDFVNVTRYREGPVPIDKNLPHEEVWEVSTPQIK
ncbi:MAG: CHASE2 domain-containing protein [Luteolibacter sp.]